MIFLGGGWRPVSETDIYIYGMMSWLGNNYAELFTTRFDCRRFSSMIIKSVVTYCLSLFL